VALRDGFIDLRESGPRRLAVVPAAPDGPSAAPGDPFGAVAQGRPPGRLDLAEARAMLDQGRFYTEYQAIVQARTGATAAFEALARFRRRDGREIAPARVFSVLHADPALLLRAELTLKLHQVEHAPPRPLFVNLDPDSWSRAGDRHRNPFLALFCSGSSTRRVVVEVTEALASADAVRSQAMIGALRGRDIMVALDDVGAANGLLSFDAIADAQVLKFDRSLLPRMSHPRSRALVQALVRMCRDTGANSVMEGVETTAEFVLARDLGFDFVQGFLFKDRSRVALR
jgi:EAL domain-containing protein (putative c-di-GMP-specific phosphodiesterase class I)